MDIKNSTDQKLLLTALEAAQRQFGLNWQEAAAKPVTSADSADARLRLILDGWQHEFNVEIKRNLRPQVLNLLLSRWSGQEKDVLLVADHVTPPMADSLRAHGVTFIDAAGNAFIDRAPLMVWIKGERPVDLPPAPKASGRAFAPSGLSVILALLCRRDAVNTSYRQIGALAGVASGAVGWVMPELEELGFVDTHGKKRKLLNIVQLFDQWAEAYVRRLRPKLLLGRFDCANPDWWSTAPLSKHYLELGGEAAASEQLDGYLRPSGVTLYTGMLESRTRIEFGLNKDERGDIEILRKFWAFDNTSRTVPMPVVYADLLTTGDARNLEAARLIRERFLAGLE